jgi:FG-GAP-like repeat
MTTSFQTATTYAAGLNPLSVTTADVNGDGNLDLVVADVHGGVAVLLGTGSGGFGAATTYAAGLNPASVTTADVNGDGNLELVVADNGGPRCVHDWTARCLYTAAASHNATFLRPRRGSAGAAP